MTITRLCCLVLGIGLLMYGVGTLYDDVQIVQTGLRTTGVIVANEYHSSGRSYAYYPVVRFVAQGGQTYVVQSRFGANPPEFRQGEAVTVYYDPRHPQRIMIDSDGQWTDPLLPIVMGAVFGLAGAWDVLPRRRRRTPTHTGQSAIRPRQNLPARRSSTKTRVRTQHKSTTRSRRNAPAGRRT